jgi:voltage-gated potassium channel
MQDQVTPGRVHHSAPYNIFILVLTVLSLGIMVLLILPVPREVHDALFFYDNLACIVFLGDFAYNIRLARPRRAYFIEQRGWLDLLGSIPSLGFFPAAGLLRLARLSRLARITQLISGANRKALIDDIQENRSSYAAAITLIAAMCVLVVSSLLVLEFETFAPPGQANIKTGGEAMWWAVVTLTTVGYGDFYPVTVLGRLTGVAVMFTGVGIIGALASILASILVPPPDIDEAPAAAGATSATPELAAATAVQPMAAIQASTIEAELAGLRADIAALRMALAPDRPPSPG